MPRLPVVNISYDGQSLNQTDINYIAGEAGNAEDLGVSTVFGVTPFESPPGSTFRGIIPPPYRLLVPVPGGIMVQPFVAMAGPEADEQNYATTGHMVAPTNVTITPLSTGSYRSTLIYATFTPRVATTPVTRKVKNPSSKVVEATVTSVSTQATVTLGTVDGAVGSNYTTIAVPADPIGGYIIPLGYVTVFNPYTSSTVLTNDLVLQTAEPFCETSRPQPVDTIRRPAGISSINFTGSSPIGSVEKWFGCQMPAATVGGATIIDTSTDWRNRVFTGTFQLGSCINSSDAIYNAWYKASDSTTNKYIVPQTGRGVTTTPRIATVPFIGQSFSSIEGPTGLYIITRHNRSDNLLKDSNGNPVWDNDGSWFELIVNQANGNLAFAYSTTSETKDSAIFLWLKGTSPFGQF